MLESVEWDSFTLSQIFNRIEQGRRLKKDDQILGKIPFVMAGVTNTGVVNYISNPVASFPANSITVDIFGNAFYRSYAFGAGDDTGVYWNDEIEYSPRAMIFLTSVISKSLLGKYSYGSKLRSSQSFGFKIRLPVQNGQINLDFMEKFVAELEAQRTAELEAYLSAAGLKDYTLTTEEVRALEAWETGQVNFVKFAFREIFDNIKQGRRLKKDDQKPGDIPFVMAGVTNTGVVNHISNPVASFPENSITLDIFGNAFYRSYPYGAGDDTGVYWISENGLLKEAMLFLTAAMQKAVEGKFSYGKKLRSSQSLNIKMSLPSENGKPDYAYMQTLISAVQKQVIKDVVHYADEKIAATKTVTAR